MSHSLITVIGPIASGKTTISQLLAKHLNIPLIDADLFEQNPFLPSYIQDNARWSFATELFFTLKRTKKLTNLANLLKKSSIVVDSGLIMSHQVYTKNHLVAGTMTASEWDFFTEIVSDYQKTLPPANVIVHVTASPKTQVRRIKARGRAFEAHYTLEYLSQITDRVNEFIRSLDDQPQVKLVTIDTEKIDPTIPKDQQALLKALKRIIE